MFEANGKEDIKGENNMEDNINNEELHDEVLADEEAVEAVEEVVEEAAVEEVAETPESRTLTLINGDYCYWDGTGWVKA